MVDNNTITTGNSKSKADIVAEQSWHRTEPFPIAADPRNIKAAVDAACKYKTQLEAALVYAHYGIPVIPCNYTPKNGELSKYPLLPKPGMYLATTDPTTIRAWWTDDPKALIGVPGGWVTGMWFLDVDSKDHGGSKDDGLALWFNQIDKGGTDTRAHKTGTGGLHFIFLEDPNRPMGCSKGHLTKSSSISVKGDGGYVIFPPSPYDWKGETIQYTVSDDCYPRLAPEWLYNKILGERSKANGSVGMHEWAEGYGQQKLDEWCNRIRNAGDGQTDITSQRLYHFARQVGGGAYDINTARDAIEKAANQNPTRPDDYVDKIKRAFDKGVVDPVEPPPELREPILPVSQWVGERRALAPPALIKGILPQTGVATIAGQSGTGKTFHAINIGIHLLPDCKENFYLNEYRIKRKGGVQFLVLEGKPAFPLRITAALETRLKQQLEFGDRAQQPFCWNTFEPDIFHKEPSALIRLVERDAKRMRADFGVDLVAVFIDTMGLAACYDNEDKAAEVQKVISRLGRVSDATGALIIGVDHYGKDQGSGVRGSSAKRGHVETILSCLGDKENGDVKPSNLRLVFEKIRDGEEGKVFPYRLKTVPMGQDEDGDPLSTCVIQWEFDRPVKKTKGRARSKTDMTLEQAIQEVGLPVDVEILRKAFNRIHGGTHHTANVAWHRAIRAMNLSFNKGMVDQGT